MLKRVVAYFVRALTLYSLLDHKKGLQKDQLSKRIHNEGTSKTAYLPSPCQQPNISGICRIGIYFVAFYRPDNFSPPNKHTSRLSERFAINRNTNTLIRNGELMINLNYTCKGLKIYQFCNFALVALNRKKDNRLQSISFSVGYT